MLLIYCLPFLDPRFLFRKEGGAPLMPLWMETDSAYDHVGELGGIKQKADGCHPHGVIGAEPTLRLPKEQKIPPPSGGPVDATILDGTGTIHSRRFFADRHGHVRFELAVRTPPLRTRHEVVNWIERLVGEPFIVPPTSKTGVYPLEDLDGQLREAYETQSLKTSASAKAADRQVQDASPRLFHTARGAPFYVLVDHDGICDMSAGASGEVTGTGVGDKPYSVTVLDGGMGFLWHLRGGDVNGDDGSDVCTLTSHFLEIFTLPGTVTENSDIIATGIRQTLADEWLRRRHRQIKRKRVGQWPATDLLSILGASLRHTDILEPGADFPDVTGRIAIPPGTMRGFVGDINKVLPRECKDNGY